MPNAGNVTAGNCKLTIHFGGNRPQITGHCSQITQKTIHMKKYTHAWLAFMAIKRLEFAEIPAANKDDAKTLVKWFRNYRDFVIEGSWYPDEVFKDMATSHVIKYKPNTEAGKRTFKKLPTTMELYKLGKKSPLYGKEFEILSGNLADRCEALSHSIVDCFKMLHSEEKGCPISPSNNHIAMRFFIMSHYIADCHMPLHCDSRSFSSGDDLHAYLESQWETQIKKSYKVDTDNERFFYDPDGYPLPDNIKPLMQAVEEDLKNRKFQYGWGTGNNNAWDYMSAISEYSYLMSYRMIPQGYDDTNLTKELYKSMPEWEHFEEYSRYIFSDAIDSIARAWLHVWARYRSWLKGK